MVGVAVGVACCGGSGGEVMVGGGAVGALLDVPVAPLAL